MNLYGKRPVIERMRVDPESIRAIYVEGGTHIEELSRIAHEIGFRLNKIPRDKFYRMSRGLNTQGVIAEVEDFVYNDYEDIVSAPDEIKPILVFLDGVTDPQNLGSIIRSLACLGGFCLVLPRRESVDVNETVLRVASGGESHMPICQVSNLSNAIIRAKREGYWIGATVVEGGVNPAKARLNFPLGLIFGSEGQGIRPGLMNRVDYMLTIPMKGADLSFNVAVAATLFCYEAAKQRE
ncbi:MAG: RNA methyltransferase [Candidatus Aenigmarchaeota archaeon]|nr:RNA methyltransferase [Candidatus Aenigmarchaeota archaeon]